MKPLLRGALALAFAAALVGCGGGSDSTSSQELGQGRPTKAQWARAAEPICRSAAKATAPLEEEFATLLAHKELPRAGQSVRRIIAGLEKSGERLRGIGVPTEGAGVVREFLARLEGEVEQNSDLAKALEADDAPGAGRAQARLRQTEREALTLAHQAGLGVCGVR